MADFQSTSEKTTTMRRAVSNDVQLNVEEIIAGKKPLSNREIIQTMTRYFRNTPVMERVGRIVLKAEKNGTTLWENEKFRILFVVLLANQYKKTLVHWDGMSQVGAAGASPYSADLETWEDEAKEPEAY